jgi:hypothetical protein
MNINIGKGGSGKITSTKGGSGKLIEKKYIDFLPSQENISLLFDPIFYNSFEERYHGSMSVPEVLKHSIRNYQYNNIVAKEANARQWIRSSPLSFKKSNFFKNTFRWIKDLSSNNDLEKGKNDPGLGELSYNDLKVPLLTLTKNLNANFFTTNQSNKSFVFFIKLQNPITHRNPNNSFLVREKKGFFAKIGNLEIGYRSPYYNIVGEPSYKGVFDNFSFVFNFGHNSYIAIHNSTFMTDFKFNFNQMYCVAIVRDTSTMRFYIDGELQNMAYLKFNPLTNNRAISGYNQPVRNYKSRRDNSPVGPGFKKKNSDEINNLPNFWVLFTEVYIINSIETPVVSLDSKTPGGIQAPLSRFVATSPGSTSENDNPIAFGFSSGST